MAGAKVVVVSEKTRPTFVVLVLATESFRVSLFDDRQLLNPRETRDATTSPVRLVARITKQPKRKSAHVLPMMMVKPHEDDKVE